MAQIVINEISQNYTFNIGTNSYATVAMPITSCWGPGYFDPAKQYTGDEDVVTQKMLENTVWRRFPATQDGLEAFVAAYRGPASCYRMAKDFSYQMAVTLLTAGYDVLTCRICPGAHATGKLVQEWYKEEINSETQAKSYVNSNKLGGSIEFRAKYPGTFGNNLQLVIRKVSYFDRSADTSIYPDHRRYYWNIITYVIDASGVRTSVESKSLVFNIDNSSDSIPYYTEVESDFWEITNVTGTIQEAYYAEIPWAIDPSIKDVQVNEDPTSEDVKKARQTYLRLGVSKNYVCGDKDSEGTYPYAKDGDNYIIDAASRGTDYDDSIDIEAIRTAIDDRKKLSNPDDPDSEKVFKTYWAERPDVNIPSISDIIKIRYDWAAEYQLSGEVGTNYQYADAVNALIENKMEMDPNSPGDYKLDPDTGKPIIAEASNISDALAKVLYYREWVFTNSICTSAVDDYNEKVGGIYDLLKDKLTYNPQRIISPGWDDQDLYMYTDDSAVVADAYGQDADPNTCKVPISPMHLKIMDVAYYGRCATGFIDTPHVVDRKYVHIENEEHPEYQGYIQELARVTPANAALDTNGTLYHTHSAFFAPWGQYTYVGTSKQNPASPSFQALMIQRAQILNQATQYEWALPTNRQHSLKLGKLDYTVPKKVLDKWQKLDGASVNVITNIPDLGTNIWGNSTLYEVPPVTYQALANLSTRYLVNAVEDCAYKCGISITFQYNNDQAYNKFYAGVTPLLDTMKNVGAIEGYRVEMSADINGLDHVNANTIIGKIWLLVNGVVNDIYVDLIALPAGAGIDLESLS